MAALRAAILFLVFYFVGDRYKKKQVDVVYLLLFGFWLRYSTNH
jgi:hypothetical protein